MLREYISNSQMGKPQMVVPKGMHNELTTPYERFSLVIHAPKRVKRACGFDV